MTHIQTQIHNLFNNAVGKWLIAPHEEEQNELPLLFTKEEFATTHIIDRTFYDNGIRWIIDFKTGQEDVLIQKKHQEQINHYANLSYHMKKEPIRCGIYYLATGFWLAWDYEVHKVSYADSYSTK